MSELMFEGFSGHVLLMGVVGSTAYGLNGPDSDVDRLGLFAAPTVRFHGLSMPKETHVSHKPDATIHEAAKFCRLALACNPTVLELLFLTEYEVGSLLGRALVERRHLFLSAGRVRDAYLGYAGQQFKRLVDRGDGSFSADTRKRTAKHARHLARLLYQGYRLYSEGVLEIRLKPSVADGLREFGDRVAAGAVELAQRKLDGYEAMFDDTVPALPDAPDVAEIEAWLRSVRAEFFQPEVRA